MPTPKFHEQRREKIIEERKKLERRWGWLAGITAGAIVTCFRVFESYLRFCFLCLESGPQGFLFLIGLHLLLILLVLGKGL
jgi:hypothetical protein